MVWEVRGLSHLDAIHEEEAVGSSVLVVLAYSRSCGACKMVLQTFQVMATEVRG